MTRTWSGCARNRRTSVCGFIAGRCSAGRWPAPRSSGRAGGCDRGPSRPMVCQRTDRSVESGTGQGTVVDTRAYLRRRGNDPRREVPPRRSPRPRPGAGPPRHGRRPRHRGRRRRGTLLVVVVLALLGVDVTGGGGRRVPTRSRWGPARTAAAPASELSAACRTGADANQREDCRIVGVVNSVQAYWGDQVQGYREAPTQFFSGQTQTGCGAATSAVGPFYCPGDQTVYIDLDFFRELRTRFGARGGAFAEAYVIAHEYGHHVQHLLGTDRRVGRRTRRARRPAPCVSSCRPTATPASGPRTPSTPGFVEDLTAADIADGLDAAAAVGDDRIQKRGDGARRPARRGPTARRRSGSSGSTPATAAATRTGATRSPPARSDPPRGGAGRPFAGPSRAVAFSRGCKPSKPESMGTAERPTAAGDLRAAGPMAFVGCGRMGGPMARRLLAAGARRARLRRRRARAGRGRRRRRARASASPQDAAGGAGVRGHDAPRPGRRRARAARARRGCSPAWTTARSGSRCRARARRRRRRWPRRRPSGAPRCSTRRSAAASPARTRAR